MELKVIFRENFRSIPFLQVLMVVVFLLLIASCKKDDPPEPPTEPYSFFVAGHTYGNHLADNVHLHPPFIDQFAYIRQYSDISLGFLTGDITRESNTVSWDAVDEDVASLGFPVYFAPGNHDVTDRALFESRYGDPMHNFRTFRSFENEKDVFILLDSELDEWNISGDQLVFLKQTLDEYNGIARNIFVFVHALIWWDDENVFKNIKPNSWLPHIPDTTNYWIAVEPLFKTAKQPVYIFAGDLCANAQATPYLYYRDGNITYIGSGMGNLVDDNFLFAAVDVEGNVVFDLIALEGDRHRFGKLEDYILP